MASSTTTAEQPTMHAEVLPEHRWLQRMVGNWTVEAEAKEPGKPEQRSKATETVRSIGDVWMIAEGNGDMPGAGPATSVLTLGYDPRTRRFVGTWIGSMMNHMWVYDGELDSAGNILTLYAEGPGMTDMSKMAKYKDVIELKGNEQRVMTSHIRNADGKWEQFMTATYQRKR